MQYHQVLFFNSEHRVGPAIVSAKLDLIGGFSERFYYGSDLSLDQSRFRYIAKQSNNVEFFDFMRHFMEAHNTKQDVRRGISSPVLIIQVLLIVASLPPRV